MVTRYKRASASIEEKKYYDYVAELAKIGSNPNDDIKKHVFEVLNIDRGERQEVREPSGNNNTGYKQPEKVEKRTITVNGETYIF